MKICKKVEKERTVIHELRKYEFPKGGSNQFKPIHEKEKKEQIFRQQQ